MPTLTHAQIPLLTMFESSDNNRLVLGRGINNPSSLPDRQNMLDIIQSLHQSSNSIPLFHPSRISSIQNAITIGSECTSLQHLCVLDLVVKYTDCFAFTLSEVKPISYMEHKVDILPGTTFPKSTHQHTLTIVQRNWLHDHINQLVEAGIVTPILFNNVKCVNPIVLAPKPTKDMTGGYWAQIEEPWICPRQPQCQHSPLPGEAVPGVIG
jgi:hypothetical protein